MENTCTQKNELFLQLVHHVQLHWKKKLDMYPRLKSRDIDTLAYIHFSKTPVTMMDLACHLKVSPAAVTQMVGNMERYGLVKREACREDHRVHYLSLHPELIAKINEDHSYFLEKLERFQQFSNNEFDLDRLFQAIVDFTKYEAEHKRETIR